MKVIFFIFFLLFVSCSVGSKYDKMVVKDSKGNLYQMKWTLGDCYLIRKIDIPKEWKD